MRCEQNVRPSEQQQLSHLCLVKDSRRDWSESSLSAASCSQAQYSTLLCTPCATHSSAALTAYSSRAVSLVMYICWRQLSLHYSCQTLCVQVSREVYRRTGCGFATKTCKCAHLQDDSAKTAVWVTVALRELRHRNGFLVGRTQAIPWDHLGKGFQFATVHI